MLILVLILTACVASLSGGLALLADTERRIASAQLRSVQVHYAAEAVVQLAMGAISANPHSSLWPSTGPVASLGGGSRVMAIAGGQAVDLDARTAELNRDAARRWTLGPDTPRWRLAGWGQLPGVPQSQRRVAVWIADDVMDADGTPGVDRNGVLMIRGEAFGPGGAARAVLAHVVRKDGRVLTVSWRAA